MKTIKIESFKNIGPEITKAIHLGYRDMKFTDGLNSITIGVASRKNFLAAWYERLLQIFNRL